MQLYDRLYLEQQNEYVQLLKGRKNTITSICHLIEAKLGRCQHGQVAQHALMLESHEQNCTAKNIFQADR